MAEVTSQMVKELRDRTGAGIKECKDILVQTDGNMGEAIKLLQEKGLRVTEKVAGREAREGRVEVYMHAGNRMAAMVELNCETDFVGRNEEFIALSKEIALQVAAMNPRYITTDEVPAEEIEASGLPAEKYYAEVVLLKQPFVRDASQTIEDKIKAAVAKLRENILVRRFTRYELGS
ncbi:MAG: translation elongation factor Ts [Roseiflexaceae bacterium]